MKRDDLRASDAERAELAARLRRATDEGRLHVEEFDERLGRLWRARTYGELDALVADLPSTGMPAVQPSGARAARPARRGLGLITRPARALLALRGRRALIAGALAAVAIAGPITAAEAWPWESSLPGHMCPHDRRPSGHFSCWYYTGSPPLNSHGRPEH